MKEEIFLPNLWCICSLQLTPTIIDIDNQQVTFNLLLNNNLVFFSSIYPSTSNLNRQNLWHKLNTLQATYNAPWTFIGNFNDIIGAHEHYGSFSPARSPINDFLSFTDSFNLIHLPTRGTFFTWNNGRSNRRHTKRRLDRTIVNQQMLDLCSSISCSISLIHDYVDAAETKLNDV